MSRYFPHLAGLMPQFRMSGPRAVTLCLSQGTVWRSRLYCYCTSHQLELELATVQRPGSSDPGQALADTGSCTGHTPATGGWTQSIGLYCFITDQFERSVYTIALHIVFYITKILNRYVSN